MKKDISVMDFSAYKYMKYAFRKTNRAQMEKLGIEFRKRSVPVRSRRRIRQYRLVQPKEE